ncbi:LysM peptidoglycan-binding domain-containing protein [Algoriphagus aquimarinus]|uniref:Membrane-bound lytic murein transglycosylase D n=1 Tax=Algoriphagus aquimarinus TaxID=237018 RepID=A0A1I0XFW3_9BACT|nr:LysM peptidoglycan-binding domain-containing protein [Algoriphagus aquimarinus]SFA98833.1 membrane-bound lytic murein transglycosylase D [Algoriphagus aquimarinus]|tara:strand:- start:86712 stop:88100 length:1389 start_codon:yes stop_codon:yes gene_type:complete
MKRPLYRTITLALITCLIPLSKAYSQDDEMVAAAPLLDEEVLPNYHYEYIPDFTYEQIDRRVKAMDHEMAFELNDKVFSFIQYFTVRNRDYTKMVLARKELFFPMFDEMMTKHDMPLEIKYLSIIESGLDPQIRSRVGAMGLWQFMPATGRMYGMNTNNDIDDRMDPELSTEAAAKYLKSLYRMFDDWEVAMAAYNCGPGNVRKAIRKSGGKKTFWGIYNYLPRETRSYVPQVQAMLYILNHLEEHNFHPEDPTYVVEYEKIRFDRALSLDKLAELTNLCVSDLKTLNPAIKNKNLPESNRSMALRIPKSKVPYIKENLAWLNDSLNNAPTILLASNLHLQSVEALAQDIRQNGTSYKVRSGDVLGSIAQRHGVTVTQIKSWNNLSSNLIRVGQTLHINSGMSNTIASTQTNSSGQTTYTVQPGDSLWIISKKHEGLTVEQIKRLNNLNSNNIKPGQKLIIG